MGGQRTKKGTRKGARQQQKSTIMSLPEWQREQREKFKEEVRADKGKRMLEADFETDDYAEIRTQMENATNSPVGHYNNMSESELRYNWNQVKVQHRNNMSMMSELDCLNDSKMTQMLESRGGDHIMRYRLKGNGKEQLVEIKETEDIGKGVFAIKDLEAGDLVTFYPSHFHCNVVGGQDKWCCPAGLSDEELMEFIQGIGKAYTMNAPSHKFIGDPRKTDKWWTLGHMINDRAYNKTLDYTPMTHSNCVYYGNVVLVTKSIQAGEELSVPYSSEYWFGNHTNAEGNQTTHHNIAMGL